MNSNSFCIVFILTISIIPFLVHFSFLFSLNLLSSLQLQTKKPPPPFFLCRALSSSLHIYFQFINCFTSIIPVFLTSIYCETSIFTDSLLLRSDSDCIIFYTILLIPLFLFIYYCFLIKSPVLAAAPDKLLPHVTY